MLGFKGLGFGVERFRGFGRLGWGVGDGAWGFKAGLGPKCVICCLWVWGLRV